MYPTALRSGDYYMFEELDDKLELDLFNKTQPDDFVEDSMENKYAHKKKMSEVRYIISFDLEDVFTFQLVSIGFGEYCRIDGRLWLLN